MKVVNITLGFALAEIATLPFAHSDCRMRMHDKYCHRLSSKVALRRRRLYLPHLFFQRTSLTVVVELLDGGSVRRPALLLLLYVGKNMCGATARKRREK